MESTTPPSTRQRLSESARKRWATQTPEFRREHTRKARLTAAFNVILESAPELTPDQKDRLRALLNDGR